MRWGGGAPVVFPSESNTKYSSYQGFVLTTQTVNMYERNFKLSEAVKFHSSFHLVTIPEHAAQVLKLINVVGYKNPTTKPIK